jgi:hypothetical protein
MSGIKDLMKSGRRDERVVPAGPRAKEANRTIPTTDFHCIKELFQRATGIITGAECTAWGLLGSVGGFCLAFKWLLAITTAAEIGVPLGFISGVAIYTLVKPPGRVLIRCLELAKLDYASKRITKKQFEAIQERCFKSSQ